MTAARRAQNPASPRGFIKTPAARFAIQCASGESLDMKKVVLVFAAGMGAALAFQAKRPVDYVNALVGTAPLDDPALIGNAPPPGEELYTGMTSPGAVLPHGVVDLSPVNKNLDLAYDAGVGMSYNYTHRTMLGFTGPLQGMMVMPVVGDWTVPPERSASYYSKDKEKAAAGYYTVYLDDYRVKVELTAGAWTGMYRFTFPKSERSHVVMDLSRAGGSLEVTGDRTVRGCGERAIRGQISGTSQRGTARTCFAAEFSKPVLAPSIRTLPPEPAAARFWAATRSAPVRGPIPAITPERISISPPRKASGYWSKSPPAIVMRQRSDTWRKRAPAGISTP
jgi:hypothetical protein